MLLVTHDIDEAIYMSDRILIMTARPGQIEHCLDVPLPRPRQRNSSEFLNLRSEILELLHLAGAPSKSSSRVPSREASPQPRRQADDLAPSK
jgi:ABC-type nitrate/sulfonate/bicarbonate transport system ATPase subunit